MKPRFSPSSRLGLLAASLMIGGLAVLEIGAQPAAVDPLEAVKAADLAMSKAVLDRDRPAFDALLTADVVFLDAPEAGREAAANSWSAFFAEKRQALLQWKPDGGKVAGSGDFAYTTGPYEFRRTGPDGKVAILTGRYLTIWQADESGRWQAWADGSWLEKGDGSLGSQLALLWPPAGAPDAALSLVRKPIKSAKSRAGDLALVVGEMNLEVGPQKAAGRYATVSEPNGEGGWRTIAEAAWLPAPVQ